MAKKLAENLTDMQEWESRFTPGSFWLFSLSPSASHTSVFKVLFEITKIENGIKGAGRLCFTVFFLVLSWEAYVIIP